MKRREALKNLGLTAGFVVAAPSVFSLLQSCTSDVETWTPVFFTQEEGALLKGIIDVILPKTDTPAASEVNVVEFVDRFVNEVASDEDQEKTRTAMAAIVGLAKGYNEDLSKLTEENYMDLLDKNMKVGDEEGTDNPNSEFLNQVKYQSIWAYRNSELVGETILAYDPVPGAAYCGDLQELTGGKAWSLSW